MAGTLGLTNPPPAMQPHADLASAARLMLDCLDRATAWRLVATNAMAIAGGLIAGLAPLALKDLVDAAQGEPDIATSKHMAALATAYLLCLACGRLLSEVRPMLASAAEQRLYGRLRLHFFRHTLHLPLGFHLDERAGAVAHALHQGITGYQVIVYSVLNSIIPVVVEATTVTAVLLSLKQPVLTMIFAATAFLYVAAAVARSRSLATAAQNVSTASAHASSVLADGLTNIEPVKCFGAEPRLIESFTDATSTSERQWSALQRQRLRGGLAVLAVFAISISASLGAAIHALRDGTLTIGGFVLANMYILQVLRPLDMLALATRDVTQALAFMGPMLRILQTPPESSEKTSDSNVATRTARAQTFGDAVEHPDSATPSSSSKEFQAPRIQFDDIRLTLGKADAIFSELTLDIPAGRTTAIVGASGCGKSTLARLLLRLWTPQRGTVLWNDQPIDALPLTTLRSRIAIVPQDTVLFNDTVAANISIGRPGATPDQIQDAAQLARLHDFVMALPHGYDTVIGERGLKLSGGERQRLAIARAILRDPLVLVLDEATSMLDGPTEQAILDDLREISAGRTTIMIAHRLAALRHVDEIVVLAGGKVAEHGDHNMLLARGGIYAAMWRSQQPAAVA